MSRIVAVRSLFQPWFSNIAARRGTHLRAARKYKVLTLVMLVPMLVAGAHAGTVTVTCSKPANGGTFGSPVNFVCSSTTTTGVNTGWRIYIDNQPSSVLPPDGNTLNTSVTMTTGSHSVIVKNWDSLGSSGQVNLLLTVTASGRIIVTSPAPGSSSFSPVQFLASATGPNPVTAVLIYVDGNTTPAFSTTLSAVNTKLAMATGTHNVVVQSFDTAGAFVKTPLTFTVKSSGVSIMEPGPNASVESAVHFRSASRTSHTIVSTKINVDGVDKFSTTSASVNAYVKLAAGPHHVIIRSTDSAFATVSSAEDITVKTPPALKAGRDQLLALPYQAGITHFAGSYSFGNGNFLLEGANRILSLGGRSIFVYLYPDFKRVYPDKGSVDAWPANTPASLTALAQTGPYKKLFAMPFKLYALTTFTFSNPLSMFTPADFATDPTAMTREEQEFYDLTLYLLNTYKGTGKTFILKNWEGDFYALQGFEDKLTQDISPAMVQAMINMFLARQHGVARARLDAGNPLGVAVFHAAELNRIFDTGKVRLINAVVPNVSADMVSYSSYDSTLAGTDATTMSTKFNQALSAIRALPDPLGMGSKRILIAEYGLFENERPTETAWRSQAILDTAQSGGVAAAFLWQVFDNECTLADGSVPIAAGPGSTSRPTNSQCRGLWVVRPDGSTSVDLAVISSHW